jgi:yecA family protein
VVGIDKSAEQALLELLGPMHRAGAALSYYQLQGMLYAVSCSPEEVKPSEWFELIWLNDEPQFDNEAEAKLFFRLVVDLQRSIANALDRGMPFPDVYDEIWQGELCQWCQGFLLGHQYVEEVWVMVAETLADEQLVDCVEAVLNITATFADVDGARQQAMEEGRELSDEQLLDGYEMLANALREYSKVRHTWSAVDASPDVRRVFQRLQAVPRDAPCPCGSGKTFGNCCLH